MLQLIPGRAIAGVVLALGLVLLGGWLNGLRWEAKYQGQATLRASERALLAEQLAGQERQFREVERQRTEDAQRIDQDAEQKIADVESRRVAAAARVDSLQQQLARVLAGRGATCDTIAGQQRQAKTLQVLADMSGRVLEFAGRAAAEADGNRVAGLACEAKYDSLGK